METPLFIQKVSAKIYFVWGGDPICHFYPTFGKIGMALMGKDPGKAVKTAWTFSEKKINITIVFSVLEL